MIPSITSLLYTIKKKKNYIRHGTLTPITTEDMSEFEWELEQNIKVNLGEYGMSGAEFAYGTEVA